MYKKPLQRQSFVLNNGVICLIAPIAENTEKCNNRQGNCTTNPVNHWFAGLRSLKSK